MPSIPVGAALGFFFDDEYFIFHIATVLVAMCWKMLLDSVGSSLKMVTCLMQQFWILHDVLYSFTCVLVRFPISKRHPTYCNKVCQRLPNIVHNNVALCCARLNNNPRTDRTQIRLDYSSKTLLSTTVSSNERKAGKYIFSATFQRRYLILCG